MSNKFHRRLTDGELHRPERTGAGNPNNQALFQVEDGQYYQDVLTGDVWRYVLSSDTWERLIDYDRENSLILNARQVYDIQTSKIGELRSNIAAGSTVTSIDAYLFTQVRRGEDITVYQSSNTDNTVSFTVTDDNEGGIATINVESEEVFYAFTEGDSIKLDAGLFSVYQSADPTKIYSSISEERRGFSLGGLGTAIAKNDSVSSVSLVRVPTDTLFLRNSQTLYIYDKNGAGQFIQVDGDQQFTTQSYTINVNTFTALYDYAVLYSYVVEPAWASTTQISQTANTVSILSQTASDTTNAIAAINVFTSELEANINTSVQFENAVGYIKLVAGVGGSEITLQSNQININGLITAINDAATLEASYTIESDTEPTQRPSTAPLQIGDVWIDTDAGNKPYVWRNTGSTEEWVAAYTQINGGDITTGTINASVVNVTNINASEIVTGTIDANVITVSNINASQLTAGTIDTAQINIKSATTGQRIEIVSGRAAFIDFYASDNTRVPLSADPSPTPALGAELKVGGFLTVQETLSATLVDGTTIKGSYKSSDDTAGISETRSWFDSAAIETHNVVIKNGIITQWTVT